MAHMANAQVFSGDVVLSLEAAVKIMNANKNDMDTWVVRPKYSGKWKYAYENMKVSQAAEIPWKKCGPMTIEQVNDLIYRRAVSGKEYSHMTNNCQHFAEKMFIDVNQSQQFYVV